MRKHVKCLVAYFQIHSIWKTVGEKYPDDLLLPTRFWSEHSMDTCMRPVKYKRSCRWHDRYVSIQSCELNLQCLCQIGISHKTFEKKVFKGTKLSQNICDKSGSCCNRGSTVALFFYIINDLSLRVRMKRTLSCVRRWMPGVWEYNRVRYFWEINIPNHFDETLAQTFQNDQTNKGDSATKLVRCPAMPSHMICWDKVTWLYSGFIR